jgi:subtilase family protein
MFTLRLFVMGLVALVPSDDSKDLMLVLQNASHVGTHPHVPVLVCDPQQSNCRMSDRNEWAEIVQALNLDVSGKGAGLMLKGEEISLLGPIPGELRVQRGRERHWWHKFIGICPTELLQAADVDWVPAIPEFDPSAGVIDESHLNSPSQKQIAALLPLVGVKGVMMSYHYPALREEHRAYVHSLTFKTKGSGVPMRAVRQAAPDVALIELQIKDPKVRIELRSFAGATRYLELAPRPGGRVVDLLLGNLTPLGGMGAPIQNDSILEHFNLYYRLSEVAPDRPKLPHIGDRRVDANRVARELPSVIRLVSRQRGAAGGVDRPVCTKAEFVRSPGQLVASDRGDLTGTAEMAGAMAAESTAISLPEVYRRLLEWVFPSSNTWYRSKFADGKEWKFTPRDDAVVVVSRTGDGAYGKLVERWPPPLIDVRAGDSHLLVLPLAFRWASSRELWNFVIGPGYSGELGFYPAWEDNYGAVRYLYPDRLRLWFGDQVSEARMRRIIIDERNSTIIEQSTPPEYYTVSVPQGEELFEAIREFLKFTEVEIAEPAEVGLGKLAAVASCVDRRCSAWGAEKVQAPGAWEREARGQGVIVAVVDTGAQLTHPSLAPRIAERGNDDWDFADPRDTVPDDLNGHGTHVAGTALAVAPHSMLMPLRINPVDGDDKQFVDAIRYVTERARTDNRRYVLNMSWTLGSDKDTVHKAIQKAVEAGVVAVAAAGNEPHDLIDPQEYPAVYDEVIAVAATYRDDERTFDSNYGEAVDVSAPGWGIRSAWNDGFSCCADGTSMAAAHVSGVAALVRSRYPWLEVVGVREAIQTGSDDIYGANHPRFKGKLGKGLVNATRALDAAPRPN